MKLTLLQQKNRPIHKLIPLEKRKGLVARTYCGVDPYRRGVRTEGVNTWVYETNSWKSATCKACLKAEAADTTTLS